MLNVECIDAELIKVCLTEDGFTSCCYVSSHHLTAEKEKQLRKAILCAALEALS